MKLNKNLDFQSERMRGLKTSPLVRGAENWSQQMESFQNFKASIFLTPPGVRGIRPEN